MEEVASVFGHLLKPQKTPMMGVELCLRPKVNTG